MWDAVFWRAKNARPDITTKIMNDIYNKNDPHLRDALKRAMISRSLEVADSERSSAIVSTTRAATSSSESAILFEDLQIIWSSIKSSGCWGLVCPDRNNSQAGPMSVNEERSRLRSLLMDARLFSMWNGEKFVVKPFQLTKISLAAFRGAIISTTVIANIQIKVARTTSEVKTPINVPEKSATEGEMPGQQEFAQQISLLDAFARNEISRISETLRNMKANLSGCEALVQQTFAVLSATDLRNDGQLANFSVTIQDQLSGISGNLSRSDMARQKFADLAENISRSESTANTNLANLTEMVLGMARNFSQFELRYQTKFNDVTGSLSLGNQKMATLSDSLSGLTLNLTKSDSLTRQRLTDMSDTISRSETSWKGKMASLGHPVGSDGKCYTSH